MSRKLTCTERLSIQLAKWEVRLGKKLNPGRRKHTLKQIARVKAKLHDFSMSVRSMTYS